MAFIDSIDGVIESSTTKGPWPISWMGQSGTAATTAATTTSGLCTVQRIIQTITVPSSFGSGITGGVMTAFNPVNLTNAGVGHTIGIEYTLGTLTVSGNSFADGVAMPTKKTRVNATTSTVTGGAPLAFVWISTTLSATTPVLTITYTNQAGTGSRTATMTLPTNSAVGSAFMINPHLQTGDIGIRDITGLSISTGTSGVLKVMGLFPLKHQGGTSLGSGVPFFAFPDAQYLIEASETLTIYRYNTTTQNLQSYAGISILPVDF